jgi:hypothetical protein
VLFFVEQVASQDERLVGEKLCSIGVVSKVLRARPDISRTDTVWCTLAFGEVAR